MKELTPEEVKKLDLIAKVAPMILGDDEFWMTVISRSNSEKVERLVYAINEIFQGETLNDCISALFIMFVNVVYQGAEADPDFMEKLREMVKNAEAKDEDTN
ncbi:MAG: hypothetical protein DSO07_06820 [Thermoproteota archaeon]|uniref:Uncharacterized protein n=1 Tax=Candidatus Methanodesulfokora washburnensis TaxID=2478471 RepID=A0A3R9QWA3_9CREN|nr:hypothetical protein [Candidatus Methanodesulfokores washburnensis]RSN73756.1 hypothetical protein D6D85_09520 [Candidatus Methanodesulfokores washburnensis]RZN60756.1 MAG: hypothetical protein EF810_05535 [Candidatus Methanodesulfokores washburnensis]TDA41025.1 MAG: hypothetical protein DSO07_06820 [Candidatus Korarchaeota archaeon]